MSTSPSKLAMVLTHILIFVKCSGCQIHSFLTHGERAGLFKKGHADSKQTTMLFLTKFYIKSNKYIFKINYF